MAFTFKIFLWGLFPSYFKDNDTYRDVDGKGIFQRYMEGVGEELDEEFYPFLTNFTNLVDPRLCDTKHLSLLGGNLGYFPTGGTNEATYRRLLSFAIKIYKAKGSPRGFKILMSILGYHCRIVEDVPQRQITYDMDDLIKYDNGAKYDIGDDYSSGFYLAIHPKNTPGTDDFNIPTPFIQVAQIFADLLRPYNAEYKGLMKMAWIEQGNTLEITDSILIT